MEKLKKAGQKLFDIYFEIGVAAMGLLAVLVVSSVLLKFVQKNISGKSVHSIYRYKKESFADERSIRI